VRDRGQPAAAAGLLKAIVPLQGENGEPLSKRSKTMAETKIAALEKLYRHDNRVAPADPAGADRLTARPDRDSHFLPPRNTGNPPAGCWRAACLRARFGSDLRRLRRTSVAAAESRHARVWQRWAPAG
jgi:hypothetical protein